MRRMGGLSKKIPITYATMLIGSLAIAGIPPLAGFFSKDEILGESFKLGFCWVWAIGFVVAGLTAFYMFRLMGLTFWGAFRGPKAVWDRDPRVAAGHDRSRSSCWPSRRSSSGMVLGLPFGASRDPRLAGAGLRRGRGDPRRTRPSRLRAVRHRRRADPRQRHRRRRRHRHRLAAVRRRARPIRIAGPARAGPRARRARGRRSSTGRRSTSGGSTTSTTCCSWSSAAGSPTALWWFDREVVDGTVNAHRPRRRSTPGAGCARSRPAGSRTTRWASPSG